MRRPALLRSFDRPGFVYLWVAISSNSLAAAVHAVALGWIALQITGSSLGVGMVFAAQNLPRLVLSVPVGAMSDRFDRRLLLQVTNLFGAMVAFTTSYVIRQPWFGVVAIAGVAWLMGIFDVLQTNICKPLVYDIVGRDTAVNGLAMEQLADKAAGIIGGVAAGSLLVWRGGGAAYFAIGTAYAFSACILMKAPRSKPGFRLADPETDGTTEHSGFVSAMREAIATVAGLLRDRRILAIATLAFTAEAFAYSSDVLLPVFSRNVFGAGEQSYGALIAARNAGGVIGILLLATFSGKIDPLRMALRAAVGFGLALIAFSANASYALAVPIIMVVGVAWATLDALLPVSMQLAANESARGAATSVWSIARGLGPAGQLEIGALAAMIGIAPTQGLNGLIVTVVPFLLYAFLRRLNVPRPEGIPLKQRVGRE